MKDRTCTLCFFSQRIVKEAFTALCICHRLAVGMHLHCIWQIAMAGVTL